MKGAGTSYLVDGHTNHDVEDEEDSKDDEYNEVEGHEVIGTLNGLLTDLGALETRGWRVR